MTKSGNDLRAKLASKQKDYLAQIKKNSGRYTLENAGINSEYSDYGSAFYNNKVIFTSARDTGSLGNRKHGWTGESFTNLYGADMGSEGTLTGAERFGKKLNSKFHESTPAFTKDGKTVYFTRNNYLDKKGKDKAGTTLLKMCPKATLMAIIGAMLPNYLSIATITVWHIQHLALMRKPFTLPQTCQAL